MGVDAIPDNLAGFIAIEAKVDETAEEVAGLRIALGDGVANLARDGIGRAGVVLFRVAEEGVQVARGGVADAEDQGILRGDDELIERGWIEAGFGADLCRVGSAGEGGFSA